MPPKRKRSTIDPSVGPKIEPNPTLARRTSTRGKKAKITMNPDQNPDIVDGKAALRASPDADEKGESLDVEKVIPPKPPITPQRAKGDATKPVPTEEDDSDSSLSDVPSQIPTPARKKPRKTPTKSSVSAKKGSDEIKIFKAEQAAKKAAEKVKVKKEDDGDDEWDKRQDPDGDEEGPAEEVDVLKREAGRPPPVNSDYLPLPWKGRLGYVCFTNPKRIADY